jgi:ABC-type nitrate/sulfonate/bicarbonate transport system permease component
MMRAVRSWAIPLAAWAALLGLWELVARLNQHPGTLWPTPRTVFGTILDNPQVFWQNAEVTLREAGLGFGYGVVLAIVLAVLAQRFPSLRDNLYRLSLTLYSIPLIALAPVLVSWVGPGLWTKVIIALLASFFPVLVNATQALRVTDQKAIELMSVLGASGLQTLLRVRLPYALPAVIASFKIAAPAAIIGAMLAEWVGAERGLGLLVLFSMFSFKVPQLWATLIVASALSLAAYYLFELAGRLLFPWHGSARQAGVS